MMDTAISRQDNMLRDSWSGQPYDGAIPYFDSPPSELIDHAGFRQVGCQGLLALYIIHKDATGRGSGMRREFHTPALGISIPAGGPAFRVLVNYEIDG